MLCFDVVFVFFFKQKTAYEMRISDWSSDVCSSDLAGPGHLWTGKITGPRKAPFLCAKIDADDLARIKVVVVYAPPGGAAVDPTAARDDGPTLRFGRFADVLVTGRAGAECRCRTNRSRLDLISWIQKRECVRTIIVHLQPQKPRNFACSILARVPTQQ